MKYIALVLFSLLWFVGFSDKAADYLIGNDIVPSDYRYGDLYRLSNLKEFRVPVNDCSSLKTKTKRPIALHLSGDSFTEPGRINGPELEVQAFTRSHVAEVAKVNLNPNLKNVLVIQTVERHFRERFEMPWQGVVFENIPEVKPTWWDHLVGFELPYNTERHESLLFSTDFMFSIKELKAWINKEWFHRVSDKVSLSKDEEHLLYYLPSEDGISSNYGLILEDEIKKWVKNANSTRNFYLEQGYDEVILSIIPNKTSILSGRDDEYNHLVERIQNYPTLEIPIIDMYGAFKRGGAQLFDLGDTHWNCEGRQVWVEKLNQHLKKIDSTLE